MSEKIVIRDYDDFRDPDVVATLVFYGLTS